MRKILISGAIVAGFAAVALGVGFGLPLYQDWQQRDGRAPEPATAAGAAPEGAKATAGQDRPADGTAEQPAAGAADGPTTGAKQREARLTAPSGVDAAPDSASDSGPAPDQPAGAADTTAPSFDVVRVSRDGVTVLAGRAAPEAEVTILDGESKVATVVANQRGEWATVLDEPLDAGNRELNLVARSADGTEIRSKAPVVILVPDTSSRAVAGADASTSGPLVVQLPAAPGAASRLLQVPKSGAAGGRTGDLSIESLDYDQEGNVVISGTARPGESVRVYLDNEPVGDAVAGPDQNWRLSPDAPVAPGDYTLRVDRLAPDGTVTGRIELPFQRADPSRLLALTDGGSKVIVQPGNSLWRIARRVYGEGIRYAVIYDANRNDIRDPDLIYPGQIFDLPRTD